MRVGGGAKRSVSLKRGCRYPWQPRERQPPPGSVTLRNSVEILTNLYTHLDQQRWGGGGGEGVANCCTGAQFVAQMNCMTSREYTSSEAWRNPHAK